MATNAMRNAAAQFKLLQQCSMSPARDGMLFYRAM
jgi:hypothetical protein